jgi:hypothetical protein
MLAIITSMKSSNDDFIYDFPYIPSEISIDATPTKIKVHGLKIAKWTLQKRSTSKP